MDYLKVANWDTWQTYRKDRGAPPWVKVHRRIMGNADWAILTDAEKGQLLSIWILAAERGGEVPANAKMIRKLCILDDEPNLARFIELGWLSSGCHVDNQDLGSCPQNDKPEAEAKAEAKAEAEEKARVTRRSGKAELALAIETWDSGGSWLLGSEAVAAAGAYRVCRSKLHAPLWDSSSWLSLFEETPDAQSLVAALKKSTQSKWLSVHPKPTPQGEKSITEQMRDTARELGI